jgi:hypothetical protein
MPVVVLPYEIIDKILFHLDDNVDVCLKLERYYPIFNISITKAIEYGDLKFIKYLYSIGKHCSSIDIGRASFYGHIDIIEFFLSIEIPCDYSAALAFACKSGKLKVVQYLHSKGATGSNNAIFWASRNGHLEIIQYLYEIMNTKLDIGFLDWAVINGHLEVVKYFYKVIGVEYARVYMYNAINNGHLEIVKLFYSPKIKYGFSVTGTAIACGQLEIVKYFHSMGKLWNPGYMDCAIFNKRLEIVKYLHSIGIKITKRNIRTAMEGYCLKIYEYCLDVFTKEKEVIKMINKLSENFSREKSDKLLEDWTYEFDSVYDDYKEDEEVDGLYSDYTKTYWSDSDSSDESDYTDDEYEETY